VTLIAAGVLAFTVGTWRFIWHRRRIDSITRKEPTPPQSD
jgi:hypothetical protein